MEKQIIYTIGFTKKNAENFFTLLKTAGVRILLDIRLNNSSQLAGFTKGKDLAYFVREILDGKYVHMLDLAPSKELLKKYQKDKDWNYYETEYLRILDQRNVEDKLNIDLLKGPTALLCSEPTANQCHRRLAAEHIQRKLLLDFEIVHL